MEWFLRWQRCKLLMVGWLLQAITSLAQGIDTPPLNLHFSHLGSKEGLSQGLIGGIVNDRDGFMWFATKDGLNRFDGYQMRVFRKEASNPFSLPENQINNILEDSMGNFWIGTNSHGLWRMDKKTERFYPFLPDMKEIRPVIGLQCKRGLLLVQNLNNCLVVDLGKVKGVGQPVDAEASVVFNWEKMNHTVHYESWLTKKGEVWSLGQPPHSSLERYYRNNSEAWQVEAYPDSLFDGGMPFEYNRLIWEDPQNQRLWFMRGKKVWAFDLLKGKIIQKFSCPPIIEARGTLFDNKLWLLTEENKRIQFYPINKTFQSIETNLDPSILLQCGTKDNRGNYWFGSAGNGLFFLPARRQRFSRFLEGKSLGALNATPDGKLIFRYANEMALAVWKPETSFFQKLPIPNKMQLSVIQKMLPDPRFPGKYWQNLDCYQLVQFDLAHSKATKIFRLPTQNSRDQSQYYYLAHINPNYQLWTMGSGRGYQPMLNLIDLSSGKLLERHSFPVEPDNQEYPFISNHWVDGQNRLWFATVQGIICFDPASKKWVRHFTHKEGDTKSLSHNVTFSLCADPLEPDRFIWVGTNGGGLNKLDMETGRCQIFTEKDGLPNSVVYGILPDALGNLWLSTNRGLCCFTPPSSSGALRTRNFSKEDGLAGDEFNRYAFAQLGKEILAFGGIDGLTWFRPREVLQKAAPPIMALTGLSVFNAVVDFRKDSLVMREPLPYASEVHLRYDQDMFRVEFTSLGFEPHSKLEYQYKLDGWDKQWVHAGNSHFATYTNLDPGTYTFTVRGKVDEEWSQPSKPLTIIISTPWWGSWWFRILVISTGVASMYAFYRYRLEQQLRILRLRDRIASDLHDEIGSTLNSIAFYGEAAQMLIPKDNGATDILAKINTQTRELMESMSDIVWSLNTRNDSFSQLLTRLESFALELLEPRGCEVVFDYPENADSVKLDMNQRRNMFLLIKEAINNSAKYADGRHLWVIFSIDGQNLTVEIRDDGRGFDQNHARRGNGIHTMKKRASELKGKLEIASVPGEGTLIRLIV